LVDARGHGGSDKQHEPEAYRLEDFAGDVVAVLEALAIEKADFWGYSMGGWVGFGMTEFAPERIDCLVIGGQHPFARSLEGFRQLLRTGIAQGHDAFLAAVEQGFGTIPAGQKARLHQADLDALLAVVAQDRENLEALLPNITAPCCLYVGEADAMCADAERASGLIPDVQFFSLPGLNHLQAFVRSDLALPHVTAFLRRAA
jgi:pimeloyl-ACP methyl ester carboxylesterase